MSYRQQLMYAIRPGRGRSELARFMSVEDAKAYAHDKSSENFHVRFYVVYNPRHDVNDYIGYYINGENVDYPM